MNTTDKLGSRKNTKTNIEGFSLYGTKTES